MNTSPLRVITLVMTGTLLAQVTQCQNAEGIEHLSQCIGMAEPLVQNPDFIFPLTAQDITGVCGMWDKFVDCVYEYTINYLTPDQRTGFNKAIETSIESIHQLCVQDPDYQRMYMTFAPCMKRVSIDNAFCGSHYRFLADLVQTNAATDAQLCCAHQKFRNCALDMTPRECDTDGVPNGRRNSASQFMRDMLDRALGFLLQKCKDSYFTEEDCNNDSPSLNFPSGNGLNTPRGTSPSGTPSFQTSLRPSNSDTRRSPKKPDSVTPNSIVPSLNIAGGGFLGGLGADSQEFKGAASMTRSDPILGGVMITLSLVGLIFRM